MTFAAISFAKVGSAWALSSEAELEAGANVTVTLKSGATKPAKVGPKMGQQYGRHLYAIAPEPKAERKTETVGDLGGLMALFDKAKQHLKFPAIVIRLDGSETSIRINVAGAMAKVPGSLNVCDGGDERTAEGRRKWFGRVTRDGSYEPAGDPSLTPAITAKLRELAADPAKAAKQHAKATERMVNGQLTGLCCFCNTLLTDPRSTAVGYGPICAKHFGLRWGK